jgi:hypothetical protein
MAAGRSAGARVQIGWARFGLRLQGTVVQQTDEGLLLAFADDGLLAGEADRVSLTTIADLVALAKGDHVAFVTCVTDAVAAREMIPLESLADCHQCRLGACYDQVNDPGCLALLSFRETNETHHQVNDSGRSTLAALAAGDVAGLSGASRRCGSNRSAYRAASMNLVGHIPAHLARTVPAPRRLPEAWPGVHRRRLRGSMRHD